MKKLLAFILILSFIAFWYLFIFNPVKNYSDAYITKEDSYYRVELTGTRLLMTHDPFSAVLKKTYEITFILKLPRITGTLEGNEIPDENGYYTSYLGNITFSEGKMVINLKFKEMTDEYIGENYVQDPLYWNGKYSIIMK